MTYNLTEKAKGNYHRIGDKWGFSINTHPCLLLWRATAGNLLPTSGGFIYPQVRIILNPENIPCALIFQALK
jgi:hypothetical protein